MPKPNAYYFYMVEKKNQVPKWRNKGFNELSTLCSEGWNSLTELEKQKYKDMKENNTDIVLPKPNQKKAPKVEKGETSLGGQDSRGNSLMEIHLRDKEKKELEVFEYKQIKTMVENFRNTKSLPLFTQMAYYIIKTTNYCITDVDPKKYCPAEITIAKFNIANGFYETVYNTFCKVTIPFGFTLAVKETCEKLLKIPLPYADAKDVKVVAKEIAELVKNIGARGPVLFTHPDERSTLIKNLEFIFGNQGSIPFRIMSLADLVSALYCVQAENHRLSPGVVCELLDPNKRGIQDGMICDYHKDTDSAYCSTEIASKWCCGAKELLHTVYKVRPKQQHRSNTHKNYDFGKMRGALEEGTGNWRKPSP